MNIPKGISVWSFDDPRNPLFVLEETHQKKYIISYLSGAAASSLIVEENYFDRDYLDEFSSFYSRVAFGYPNICKRIHVFGPDLINRNDLVAALSEDDSSFIQKNYLGFIVIRPIPSAPFGRTVLSLYHDRQPDTPRITEPARDYFVHLAGIRLKVNGLAWQQQDTGVAACATIGLWTMFHSSAFDDHHSIPTTAEITKSAEQFGARAFPSNGLTADQILEAIHRQNFNPVAVSGDIKSKSGETIGFSSKRFSVNCMSFVRSGYPVLLLGHNGFGAHAICLVGSRENPVDVESDVMLYAEDENCIFFYIHDDNFGPNIRYRLDSSEGLAKLKADPPGYVGSGYPSRETCFIPTALIVATNQDVRINADDLFLRAEICANVIFNSLNQILEANGDNESSVIFNARFMLLRDYMGKGLSQVLQGEILGKTRLSILEDVPPMSLHVGVVRVAFTDGSVIADILHDTTDSSRNMPVFASIIYDQVLFGYLKQLPPEISVKLGLSEIIISAF